MDILFWIILGGAAGWGASVLMKTDQEQGFFSDIILGILGALIGGFIFSIMDKPGVTGFNLYSYFVALIGSVVLIWIGRYIFGRR